MWRRIPWICRISLIWNVSSPMFRHNRNGMANSTHPSLVIWSSFKYVSGTQQSLKELQATDVWKWSFHGNYHGSTDKWLPLYYYYWFAEVERKLLNCFSRVLILWWLGAGLFQSMLTNGWYQNISWNKTLMNSHYLCLFFPPLSCNYFLSFFSFAGYLVLDVCFPYITQKCIQYSHDSCVKAGESEKNVNYTYDWHRPTELSILEV